MKGVGVLGWALKGIFGLGQHSECSVLTPWQCFQNPAGLPGSLERNLEDADKKTPNDKNPGSVVLVVDASPVPHGSQLCCFNSGPQAIPGLTASH